MQRYKKIIENPQEKLKWSALYVRYHLQISLRIWSEFKQINFYSP